MDEKLQRTLGEAARAARLRLGLTQEEVAKQVGLAQSVYGRIERGAMMPSVPTLRKLCLALGNWRPTEGGLMRLLGPGSSGIASGRLMAVVIALVSALGCAGADAALADVECNQTDSTVSCCLKMNPGQYERCGVTPPPQPVERINAAVPKLPTRAEKERWRKDICTPAYERCIAAGGGSIEGRVWDETQCKACFEACMRHGSWPKEANDKPCPGA